MKYKLKKREYSEVLDAMVYVVEKLAPDVQHHETYIVRWIDIAQSWEITLWQTTDLTGLQVEGELVYKDSVWAMRWHDLDNVWHERNIDGDWYDWCNDGGNYDEKALAVLALVMLPDERTL